MKKTELKRSLSLPLLIFYGMGTILGAGIYVLIGEVAGVAGKAAPLSFLLAAIVAGFTALSYGELSARIPKSAGEAAYLGAAFRSNLPAMLAGYGVIITGMISSATILNGFVGYLGEFITVQREVTITLVMIVLTFTALRGVNQSVWVATIVTILELLGLLIVIGFALKDGIPAGLRTGVPEMFVLDSGLWSGVFMGAFLAFFAYIGFEDIVNMAEEVKNPRRNLPRAIIWSLIIATFLYLVVALLAVNIVPPQQLAKSSAPLAEIISAVQTDALETRKLISFISLVAIINGALIQLIMASRVMYGMARQGLAPSLFSDIFPKWQTPLKATLIIGFLVTIIALSFKLLTLALATSMITLSVFCLVNIALIRLKAQPPKPSSSHISYPLIIPWLGLLLSLALLVMQILGNGH